MIFENIVPAYFVMCVGQLDKRLLSILVSGKWKGLLRSKQTEGHFILMLNVAHFVIKNKVGITFIFDDYSCETSFQKGISILLLTFKL